MRWFIIAASIVGYLTIAVIVARRVFVAYIDKHGRNAIRIKDEYGPTGEYKDPFARPFWSGIGWLGIAVVVGAIWLWRHGITRPTAAERRTAKETEARRQELQVRELASRTGLPYPKDN